MVPEQGKRGAEKAVLLFLFFLSGLAALIYEVLWLKELGLLFGNTAYAAATTLAVFFLGLSAGGYVWGKKAASIGNPLRTYALLEFGVCSTAFLYFLLLDAYYLFYSPLYVTFGYHRVLFVSVKFLLAAGLLFLPAFFMGGTFPMMGQHLIRRSEELGKTGSLLYAINTTGAALGAFLAGFYLPVELGYDHSYVLGITLNFGIGVAAYAISVAGKPVTAVNRATDVSQDGEDPARQVPLTARISRLVAFISGFIALSLEVLWTRMFAQVLHNSVYSFSAILITFLFSLALGSVLASMLCRLRADPFAILTGLLILSGMLVGGTPLAFYWVTDGLEEIASYSGWTGYVISVFAVVSVVILIPGTLLGSVFPYLLKMRESISESAGRTIGHLAAVNTIGAILGSVTAGFILLSYVGLWVSIKAMAVVYFVTAIFITRNSGIRHLSIRAVPVVGVLLLVSFLYSSNLPLVKISPEERLHEVWEGSHGTVAVVEESDDLFIKVNNYYTLGSVSDLFTERMQAYLPLFIHPNPRTVFFLGMGTGITPGAALDFPVRSVVTCELVPEVVTASKKYFREYTNGLFDDARSEIVVADGRNYLLGMPDTYDVIISDLFIPWKAGAGSLYAKEHFQMVYSRLSEGGMFALWLPLHQVSKTEFSIIARTMMEVFPQVTLWRGNLLPRRPVVALLGHSEKTPLDSEILTRNVKRVIRNSSSGEIGDADIMPYILYAGNLTEIESLFEDYSVNTDNRPVIEYVSPVTHKNQGKGKRSFLTGLRLAGLFDDIFHEASPDNDPFLLDIASRERGFVKAGLHLIKAVAYREAKRFEESRVFYKRFQSYIPAHLFPDIED